MSRAALVLALLIGCSTGDKSAAEPARPPEPSRKDPVTQPEPRPLTTLADLQAHEGTVVDVAGTFRFPTEKAFARNKLILDDGTTVVLSRPADDTQGASLTEANQGARMVIRGAIYIKEIPPKYNIVGRTPDPYLLDIEKITLTP